MGHEGYASSATVSHIEREQMMRAVFYNERGEIERLQVGDQPKPVPAPGEVLIKIHAAAVGIWDVKLPMIPGCEVAGVVEARTNGSGFKSFDKVYGFLGFKSGGFAEYATAERRSLVQLLFNKQPTREGETL